MRGWFMLALLLVAGCSFGESEFPRHSRVLDARERRGAGASVEAADENDIRVGFGNAGRNRADADFGDEFHRNARGARSAPG